MYLGRGAFLLCFVLRARGEAVTDVVCTEAGRSSVLCDGVEYDSRPQEEEEETLKPWTKAFDITLGCACFCVTAAALAAGLTMGLMSIDEGDMQLLQEIKAADLETEEEQQELLEEQKAAGLVIPLIKNHHLLLVTLLLINALANEALPLFLGKLVPAWLALLLSVSMVLLFGEIVPTAIFTGPSQLSIAARCAPLVRSLQIFLLPVAWPIAKALDLVLGSEHRGGRYSKAKLKAVVAVAAEAEIEENDEGIAGGGSQIRLDEVKMVHGVMDLAKQKVRQHMIPLGQVKMLSKTDIFDIGRMADVYSWGHSRLPVFDGTRENIRGVLIIKKCVVLDPEDCRNLKDLGLRKPLLVEPREDLHSVLKKFVDKKNHMALVTNSPESVLRCWKEDIPIPSDAAVLGIITLEDVIEELIKEEIQDEGDRPGSVKAALDGVCRTARRRLRLKELADNARKKVAAKHEAEAKRKPDWAQSSSIGRLAEPLLRKVTPKRT